MLANRLVLFYRYLIFICLIAFSSGVTAQNSLRIWFDKPAADRSAFLPLGNGQLAALVSGNPLQESIILNEATAWSGTPGNNINPEAKAALPQLRAALKDKNNTTASALIASSFTAGTNPGAAYQTIGGLNIRFPLHKKITAYSRELNIANATAVTRYTFNGVVYTREYFVSFTDSVLIVRLKASKPKSISCDVTLNSPHQRTRYSDDGLGMLMLNGWTSGSEGANAAVQFAVRTRPLAKNGRCFIKKNVFSVQGADEVTICLSIATNVKSYKDLSGDENEKATRRMAAAYGKDFEVLKNRHVKAYQASFKKTTLDLGTTPQAQKPTDVRLNEFAKVQEPALAALYFAYGRYLLLSCSNAEGQPVASAGLWSDELSSSDKLRFALDFAAMTKYQAANSLQLPETSLSLLNLVRDLSLTGKQTAADMYGMRGWAAHQATDVWRTTGAVDASVWPLGGAWLCRQLWEHFLYTGDKVFLESYYPVMADAARFYVDYLSKNSETGYLQISPLVVRSSGSIQPAFATTQNSLSTLSETELVRDVFVSVVRATDVLNSGIRTLFGNDATAFADTLKRLLPQFPPLKIADSGTLLYFTETASLPALYDLYPASRISPVRTPDWSKAAKNTLAQLDASADNRIHLWMLGCRARLLDGDLAYRALQSILKSAAKGQVGGVGMNLLDGPSCLETTDAVGAAAGISEMLVQSHDGFVYLLPALPAEWKNGSFSGVAVRGGFTLDLTWKNGRLEKLRINSALGGNFRLRSVTGLTAKGLKPAKGDNPNGFYWVDKQNARPAAGTTALQAPDAFEYDLKTEPGQVVEVVSSVL